MLHKSYLELHKINIEVTEYIGTLANLVKLILFLMTLEESMCVNHCRPLMFLPNIVSLSFDVDLFS
jgi:hypothetical protein